LIAIGALGIGWCFVVWASSGFGPLDYPTLLRVLVLSLTAIVAGLQLTFTAFLAAMIEIPTGRQGRGRPSEPAT
jgi:hypothetical protein